MALKLVRPALSNAMGSAKLTYRRSLRYVAPMSNGRSVPFFSHAKLEVSAPGILVQIVLATEAIFLARSQASTVRYPKSLIRRRGR
jgi:hypothetical protein